MSGKDALASQLGDKTPPKGVLDTVADDDLQHLADTVRAARRRQGEALAAAGEHSLRFVPGLLRRPFKKMLNL
jgi:hypothetical protein